MVYVEKNYDRRPAFTWSARPCAAELIFVNKSLRLSYYSRRVHNKIQFTTAFKGLQPGLVNPILFLILLLLLLL